MSWGKFDDNAPDNAKWLCIPARHRADAWTLWTCSSLRSNRLDQDGRIPAANELTGTMGMSKKRVRRAYHHLIVARLIDTCDPVSDRFDDETNSFCDQIDHETNSIHDFLEYNPSAEEKRQRREKNAEKLRRHRSKEPPCNQVTNPAPGPTRPDPSPNDDYRHRLKGVEAESPPEPTQLADPPIEQPPPEPTKLSTAHQSLRLTWARNFEKRTGQQFNPAWHHRERDRIGQFAEWISQNATTIDGAQRMAEDLVNGFFASRKKNYFRWEYLEGHEGECLERGHALRKPRAVG